MDRREFLRAGALAGAGVLAGPFVNRGRYSLFADERVEHSARAVELVGRSTVIDMLGLLTLDWPKLYAWQREPGGFGAGDLERLKRSGVNVFHPAVEPNEPHAYTAILDWISGWDRLLTNRTDCFLRVGSAQDLQRARSEGKVGILVGFQNSDHFRTVDDVQRFYALGQRVSQLTYNARNRIGCGCREARDTGLSPYGAQIVEAMNRAGMAIDVSHCSERTCLDAFAISHKPVLVTHSNCRALAAHPRCKSDAVIRGMAARGGVMGITVVPAFVSSRQPATIDNVLDHFDRVARLAGVEHVGLGSDVDPDALDPRTGHVRARYDVHGLVPARRVSPRGSSAAATATAPSSWSSAATSSGRSGRSGARRGRRRPWPPDPHARVWNSPPRPSVGTRGSEDLARAPLNRLVFRVLGIRAPSGETTEKREEP